MPTPEDLDASCGKEPELTVPREALAVALAEQVAKGEELANRQVATPSEIEAHRHDYYTWNEFNSALIRRCFTTSEPADEYASRIGLTDGVEVAVSSVKSRVRRLISLRERLPLFDVQALSEKDRHPKSSVQADRIFVVHGHNEQVRIEVADFIRRVTGREPVVLHEQPNSGRTVIEKFELHAETTAFAVVLLTGDDRGIAPGSGRTRPRARQNVIFELGFFIGALGRERVAALHEAGVELPSDIGGMLYTALSGNWRAELAREMRAAGIRVDLNQTI